MPDSDVFVQHCDIAMREGSYGESSGNDRWRMPTWNLMLKRSIPGGAQLVIISGLRFDRPVESIARVLRQFPLPERKSDRADAHPA